MSIEPSKIETADSYLIELLTRTQRQHLIAMDGPDEEPKARVLRASVIVSQFSAAWFLSKLIQLDPAQAEEVVGHLRSMLADGASVGEWTWELLCRNGVDPSTITPAPAAAEVSA